MLLFVLDIVCKVNPLTVYTYRSEPIFIASLWSLVRKLTALDCTLVPDLICLTAPKRLTFVHREEVMVLKGSNTSAKKPISGLPGICPDT